MYNHIGLKSLSVKKKIEEDFRDVDEQELEKFFDRFKNDKRTVSFIKYYNETVLDKTKIKFSEFSYQWALHLSKKLYTFFNENFYSLATEIENGKDIRNFHDRFCVDDTGKRNGSFCSKLFHTVLPSEFPPVDNPIRRRFNLQNEDFITSVLITKNGYELFIRENSAIINSIRKLLSKSKFEYLRVSELSDIRILDMYYWFKENKDKNQRNWLSVSKPLTEFS